MRPSIMEYLSLFYVILFIEISFSLLSESTNSLMNTEAKHIRAVDDVQANNLTPAEWELFWFSASLITYMRYSRNDQITTKLKKDAQFVVNQLQPALIDDSMESSEPLIQLNEKLKAINIIRDTLMYSKGSSIIRMINLTFGVSVFHTALRNYLKMKNNRALTLDDLWLTFQKQIDHSLITLPTDIKTIMDSWTRQAGFPVLNVEINNGIAKLNQKRYILDLTYPYSTNTTWWIPLIWASENNADFSNTIPKYWFHKTEDEIELQTSEDEWVIFNVQQAGFYRVNYDEVSWYRIIHTITYDPLDKIPAISRATIINDLFNLAKSGSLSFEIALNSLIYINREIDYLPIETILTELEFLYKRFYGKEPQELFHNFFLELITPIYERLGFYDNNEDDDLIKILRKKITDWTCRLGHKECNDIALELFFKWHNNLTFDISINRKNLVFCTAIKSDSCDNPNGAIELIKNYYEQSSNLLERAIAIDSLGCIQDTEILNNIINSVLDTNENNFIQKQEIIFMFKAIVKHNYNSTSFIKKFIIKQYEKMLNYYGNHEIFYEIISTLAGMTMTEQEAQELFFFNEIQDEVVESLPEVINFAIKEINFNNYFFERYHKSIVTWIKNNHFFISFDLNNNLNHNNYIEIKIIERCFFLFRLFYSGSKMNYNSFIRPNLKDSMQQMSYFLWKRTFKDFEYLISRISHTDTLQIVKLHMLAVIEPIYNKLGLREKENESYEEKLLRIDIVDWACKLNHVDCIKNSLKLFKNWRSNSQGIPKNLRKTIFCTVMKWGSVHDIDFIINKNLNIKVPEEKDILECAIGCSEIYSIEEKLSLIMGTTAKFTTQEKLYLLSFISSNYPTTIHEILFPIINHALKINSNFNLDELSKIFKQILFHLFTEEQFTSFEKVINLYKNTIPELVSSLHSYIIEARNELERFNNYSTDFINWLESTYSTYDYRLPKTVKPLKYEIALAPEKDFFFGSVKIVLKVLEDISHIVLHANKLEIDQIDIFNVHSKSKVKVLFCILHRDHRLEIYLNTVVKSGTHLKLTIWYSNVFLTDKTDGFFRSSYQDSSGTNHWLLATQFQKNDARRAFPCFDEPAFKARFEISIMRPNHYHTLSNMKLKISVPSDKRVDWTWDHYEQSALMSTYLVAFVVCDYEIILHFKNNVRFWSYRSVSSYDEYSGHVVEKSLNFLEDYTGIPSPMAKLDLVEIPQFYSAGMENWGLIILDDSLMPLVVNHSLSNIFNSITFREFVIAHEIVHTWFGNLVTCETWKYYWLNEGFTRFFEWLILDSLQPNIRWMEKFITYVLQIALQLDSLVTTSPLTNDQLNLISYSDEYDDFISHQKSASIIRMMYYAFGEDVFHRAVKHYLKQHQYNTSTPSDLWFSIEMAMNETGSFQKVNQTVATLMESWVSQPGYPVVHVSKIGNNLILTQKRFVITRKDESLNELYWIPITITSASDSNFENTLPIVWMGSKKMNITLPNIDNKWIILNLQQTGFYRVNYDVASWLSLFKALNKENFGGIPEIHRAQIIDDLFNLARANYISYGLALSGSQYLIKETGHLPWKAFFRAIETLYDKFDSEIIETKMREYLLYLITPIYKKLQFEEKNEDTSLDKLNRALILSWAHKLDLFECIFKSLLLLNDWFLNPDNKTISLDEQALVLCSALRHGGYEAREFLWNQYFKAKFDSEKISMLRILGCSQNVTAIIEYLYIAVFNSNPSTEDIINTMLSSIFSSKGYAIDASLRFVAMFHNNISQIHNGWALINPLFNGIAKTTLTSMQISKLKRLIKIIKDKNVKNKLKRILFIITKRKKWYDRHAAVIEHWLITKEFT